MTDHPEPHWTERSWFGMSNTIADEATARAFLVPEATGDPHSSRDAWFWHTTNGNIVAVTKRAVSVHESAVPFDSLTDAAEDFHAYWPAGLIAEQMEAEGWMGYVAAKSGQPVAPSGLHP